MKPEDIIGFKPLEVTLRKNESTERMIKRFMKKVRNDGILKEFSHRTSFEKPSVIRRRKREQAKWAAKYSVRK
ncbi:MAG: 30S ribosomal protein S21 [Candidatus Thorarchaeota archaeon]